MRTDLGWKTCLVALVVVAAACSGGGTVSDSPEQRLEVARSLARQQQVGDRVRLMTSPDGRTKVTVLDS